MRDGGFNSISSERREGFSSISSLRQGRGGGGRRGLTRFRGRDGGFNSRTRELGV